MDTLKTEHPDIQIVVGYIDDQLTDEGYIYPGVGDVRSCWIRINNQS